MKNWWYICAVEIGVISFRDLIAISREWDAVHLNDLVIWSDSPLNVRHTSLNNLLHKDSTKTLWKHNNNFCLLRSNAQILPQPSNHGCTIQTWWQGCKLRYWMMCRWYSAFNLGQKSYLFHKYIPPQWGRGPTCPSPARPWRARAGPPGCPRCPLTRRRWLCWPAPAASPGSPGSRSRGWSSAWPGQVMSVNIQILS